MMQNFHYHRAKLVAALVALPLACTLGAAKVGAVESAQRLVVAQAADKASGDGVIKGVNESERKLQITHGPIPALKWPAMTMAFGVAPGIDLSGLAPGAKVKFSLSRDAKGLYVIDQITRTE
jgi:Cu(I)/Ag(I) efflux system protein CusF